MPLSTLVKISGVNNLSNARYCAGMGAGILGFCPEPYHPDFVDPDKFKEITGWIKGVKLAGEFYTSQAYEIVQTDAVYGFDFLQVSRADTAGQIQSLGKPVFIQIDLTLHRDTAGVRKIFDTVLPEVQYFVIEGNSVDNNLLREIYSWSNNYTMLMGANIRPDNI